MFEKDRLALSLAVLAVGVLGYWLRFDAPAGPGIRDAGGGILYVVFWIVAGAAVKPDAPVSRLASLVFVITCTLEFLQLWHPAWLEAIRRTLPGRAVLGTTFEWTDFPPYAVGAIAGWGIVRLIRRRMSPLR
jgi:hypothetical protein